MEKAKNKIREPFEPEDTPNPPQIIEPNSGRQRENPIENKERAKQKPDHKESAKQKPDDPETGKIKKPHLPEGETEINDETTV